MTAGTRSALQGVAALAAVVLAVGWLSGGCEDRIAPEDAPPGAAERVPEAQLATVRADRAPAVESAAGTIESARHTTVSSEILARIEEVRPRAGTHYHTRPDRYGGDPDADRVRRSPGAAGRHRRMR